MNHLKWGVASAISAALLAAPLVFAQDAPRNQMPQRSPMQGQNMGNQEAQTTQRDNMMLLQAKRMAKMLAAKLKILQAKIQKLKKVALAPSTDCIDTIASAQASITAFNSATVAADVEDSVQDTSNFTDLMTCMREADQLLQAPAVIKTIPKMIAKLKKANIDVSSIQSDFDTIVLPAFAVLKSGSASQDQVDDFFTAVSDIRGSIQSAFKDAGVSISKDLQPGMAPQLPPLQEGTSRPLSSRLQNQLANIASALKNFFGIK